MSKTLSYEDAVSLFLKWGFSVEDGPREGEVTLILEGPEFKTYNVYSKGMLSHIASVALAVRLCNTNLTGSKMVSSSDKELHTVGVWGESVVIAKD